MSLELHSDMINIESINRNKINIVPELLPSPFELQIMSNTL